MIETRVAGSVLGVLGAATATGGRAPEVWHLLGYPFEAAGMIAAIFGCACASVWRMEQQRLRKALRWGLGIPTSAISIAATIGAVIAMRPEPLVGLLTGAGIGVIGEGLFKLAQRYVERLGLLGDPPAPVSVPPSPLPTDIHDLTRKFDEEPQP